MKVTLNINFSCRKKFTSWAGIANYAMGRTRRVSNFGGKRTISLFQKVRLWGPLSLLFNEYRGSSARVKQPEDKCNHSPPSSAKGTNEWCYTSTLLYAFWHGQGQPYLYKSWWLADRASYYYIFITNLMHKLLIYLHMTHLLNLRRLMSYIYIYIWSTHSWCF